MPGGRGGRRGAVDANTADWGDPGRKVSASR